MEKSTTFSNTITKTKNWFATFIAIVSVSINSYAQTNPTGQTPTITENFGTTTFSTLAAHFAAWTVNSSPIGSQGNAESSTTSGNATIFAASGTQTTGGCYGYAVSSNGRFYIQTSSNGTNGTNQLAGAINATGLGSIVIAYDIEMISANPRTIGVELQYRVGTAGAWTNVSGTVYSHTSTDRSNGNIDSYNVTLPSGADNNAVVQIRWVTWRGSQTGNSSGIAIDNISITASTFQSTYYFRSKQSGNWNSATTWEVSPDNSTWSNAATTPNYGANTITVSVADSVSITATDTLDQVVVNGILSYEDVVGSTPSLYNGAGTELTINGKFYDAGPNSITWLSGATWSLGSGGYLIRNRGTSSNNWRDNYAGSISTIPATAHWIARKNGTDSPTLSSTGMYYPNLKIENYTGSGWTTGTSSSFTGSASSPVIKGDLLIGGNGSNTVSFLNSNTATAHVYVLGDLTLKSGSTLRNQGTGFQVEGDLNLSGTVDYGGTGAGFILSGNGNQNLSGNLTFASFELNKSSTSATITLQSPATITGAFSFIKGYLITSPTNLLTFAHHASVGSAGGPNTNDSSFVKGPVRKIGNSVFTFPLGKGSNYQYIRISAPADTTDAYTAEYFNTGQTLGTATDPTYDYISTCEYFTLDRTTGASNVSVTLAYDMFSCVANLFPDPRIIGWDGSKWADLGTGTITASPFGGSIASDGPLTQYGEITLGNNSNSTIFPPDTAIIPSSFRYIKNSGQLIATNDSLRPDIKYYMNDAYPQAYFSDTALSYVFAHIDTIAASTDTMVRVDVQYLGANSTYPVAQKADSTYTNYFLAHCPNGVTGVTQHQRLNYSNLYNRIDLIYRQNSSGLKFAFNVYPGGKPDAIKAKYTGADSVKILVTGQLRIYTRLGNLTYNAPNAFKVDSSGLQSAVACNWNIANGNEVSFIFPGGHNSHLPLAIMIEQDVLSCNGQNSYKNIRLSSYYGAPYHDKINVTHVSSTFVYYAGSSSSLSFPVTDGTSTGIGDETATLSKFDAYGNKKWATYYGGSEFDEAYGLVSNSNSDIIMVGYTWSTNFPLQHSGSQYWQVSGNAGLQDGFIVRLNSGGTQKLWSTYFGGSGNDVLRTVTRVPNVDDPYGNLYVGGTGTETSPHKTKTGAYNSPTSPSGTKGLIAHFNASDSLVWSTFIGTEVRGIDYKRSRIGIGGLITSSDLPYTYSGADYIDSTLNTGGDAFFAIFNSSTDNINWATYYGGSRFDVCNAVKFDNTVEGNPVNLYAAGQSGYSGNTTNDFSTYNPGSGAYFNGTFHSDGDAVLWKFTEDGERLWATYYGTGSQADNDDYAMDVEVDRFNNVYFCGSSNSQLENIAFGSHDWYNQNYTAINSNYQAFIFGVNKDVQPFWATNFGGNLSEQGMGLSVDYNNDYLYLTGNATTFNNTQGFPAYKPTAYTGWYKCENSDNSNDDGYFSQFDISSAIITGINEQEQQQFAGGSLIMYPNPSGSQVTFSFNVEDSKGYVLEIYNTLGQLVYAKKEQPVTAQVVKTIDLDLNKGVYFVQIKLTNRTLVGKLIKQ